MMTRICNAREKTEYDRCIRTSKKLNEDAIEKQNAIHIFAFCSRFDCISVIYSRICIDSIIQCHWIELNRFAYPIRRMESKNVVSKIWQKCMHKFFHRIFSFRPIFECVPNLHNKQQLSLQCKKESHILSPTISTWSWLFLSCESKWKKRNANENEDYQCSVYQKKTMSVCHLPGADRVIGITAKALNNTNNSLWSR